MSQNPPDSSTDNNSKDIPKVVGDHADRLMDSLFADIEELLGGDSHAQQKSPPTAIKSGQQPAPSPSPEFQPAAPGSRPHYQQPALESNTAINNPPQRRNWQKILIGLSLAAIAAGAGIWWLAKERKINLDALLPSDASKADIQFADYLRRSVGKIDSSTTAQSPPANQVTMPNPPSVPVATPSLGTRLATPATPVASSFTKVIKSRPPTVEFVIDGQVQRLNTGDKIGKSGWTLGTVAGAADNEIIIKRNGELRTLKAGQQF